MMAILKEGDLVTAVGLQREIMDSGWHRLEYYR